MRSSVGLTEGNVSCMSHIHMRQIKNLPMSHAVCERVAQVLSIVQFWGLKRRRR